VTARSLAAAAFYARHRSGFPSLEDWAMPPGWPAAESSLDRLPTPEEEMFAEARAATSAAPTRGVDSADPTAVGRVWTAPLVQGRWRENF